GGGPGGGGVRRAPAPRGKGAGRGSPGRGRPGGGRPGGGGAHGGVRRPPYRPGIPVPGGGSVRPGGIHPANLRFFLGCVHKSATFGWDTERKRLEQETGASWRREGTDGDGGTGGASAPSISCCPRC